MKTSQTAHKAGSRDPLRSAARSVCSLVLLLAYALVVIAGTAQVSTKPETQPQTNGGAAGQKKGAAEAAKNKGVIVAKSDAKSPANGSSTRAPQKIVHEGIEVEFTIDPLGDKDAKSGDLMEGQDAVVSFKITESRNGTPLVNLHPSAWMDLRAPGKLTESKDCRQKIQSFLQSALSSRPEIDLNTYFILTLNQEANISVIDPLMGYGSSKLFTLVFLNSPGEDWVLSSDKKRLFVTMPLVNQVAVIDTALWRVAANIDVGAKPTRVAFQPDEKYLWVGSDAGGSESGVTVIDAVELKVAARIKTGAGHHEIALRGDNRYAYVTNRQDGTLSVIDVQKLVKVKDIKTGGLPVSLALSPLSKAAYVANEEDGTIVVIGGVDQEVLARITTKPGVKAIRFFADGRYGFAVNGKENNVQVIDASTNRLVNTIKVGKNPDKISFTQNYAYVRALGSDQVSLIQLDGIGKKAEVPVLEFPAGQLPAEKAPGASTADVIVPAPEGGSVLVVNPADKMIYYYTEGMAAPMGSFQNYRREPRAVMVWDKSLREVRAGVYTTNIKLPTNGEYDVAFLLDSPRIAHCFSTTAKTDPALKKQPALPIDIEPLIENSAVKVGENVKLQFRVTDSTTKLPRPGLKDFGVLVFLAPGQVQDRQWAQSLGNGIYEVTFKPEQPGAYYVFVHCPSLRVNYNQTPHFILRAGMEKTAAPAKP